MGLCPPLTAFVYEPALIWCRDENIFILQNSVACDCCLGAGKACEAVALLGVQWWSPDYHRSY